MADKLRIGNLAITSILALAAGIALFTFLENRFPAIQNLVRGPTG